MFRSSFVKGGRYFQRLARYQRCNRIIESRNSLRIAQRKFCESAPSKSKLDETSTVKPPKPLAPTSKPATKDNTTGQDEANGEAAQQGSVSSPMSTAAIVGAGVLAFYWMSSGDDVKMQKSLNDSEVKLLSSLKREAELVDKLASSTEEQTKLLLEMERLTKELNECQEKVIEMKKKNIKNE
eukprot:789646_1